MSEQQAQQRQEVITEAISWLLTPHHHGAQVKGPSGGVDCALFPAEVAYRVGLIPQIKIAPENYPSPQFHLHRSENHYLNRVLQYCDEIPGPPLPGDLVLYQFGRTKSHGAIVIDWPRVIHAAAGRAVEYADGEQMYIEDHAPLSTTFYRYKGWGVD